MADTRPAALSAAAILLLAVAGWTAYSTDLLRTHPAQAATASIATGTALVTRTDVQQQTAVTGTLGYAGNYSVIAPAGSAAGGGATGFASVITWLPAAGATVRRGEPAYAVGGQPVPLFYGARPAWRDMAPGIPPGPDVRQLQRNLAAPTRPSRRCSPAAALRSTPSAGSPTATGSGSACPGRSSPCWRSCWPPTGRWSAPKNSSTGPGTRTPTRSPTW